MKSKKQIQREKDEHSRVIANLQKEGWYWTQDFPAGPLTIMTKCYQFITVKKGKIIEGYHPPKS